MKYIAIILLLLIPASAVAAKKKEPAPIQINCINIKEAIRNLYSNGFLMVATFEYNRLPVALFKNQYGEWVTITMNKEIACILDAGRAFHFVEERKS